MDKNFLLAVKEKFWEQRSQDIKTLIHLRDHIEVCLFELKKLEVDVSRSESIFDPILDQVKRVNKKLNEISNEKVQALNIGDQVELMEAINYLV